MQSGWLWNSQKKSLSLAVMAPGRHAYPTVADTSPLPFANPGRKCSSPCSRSGEPREAPSSWGDNHPSPFCTPLTSPRSPLRIRPYGPADWPALWALLEPVFRAGETFPHDPAISEAEARLAWVEQSQAVMVAVDPAGAVVGTYYLRPNSLALGAHVANAGYVVAERARRQGIGSRLCQHSLQAARKLGFRAMQFNLVVSTNTAGIRCWQRNGFQVVGTLPGAFRHRQLGYVDALVMVQRLVEEPKP
jgi:L-amino acid N-acyltransferase YncA